jgi:hypothetical protein
MRLTFAPQFDLPHSDIRLSETSFEVFGSISSVMPKRTERRIARKQHLTQPIQHRPNPAQYIANSNFDVVDVTAPLAPRQINTVITVARGDSVILNDLDAKKSNMSYCAVGNPYPGDISFAGSLSQHSMASAQSLFIFLNNDLSHALFN